jgi:cytochrome c553
MNLIMNTGKLCITLLLLASANVAFAETPDSLIAGYTAEAAKSAPGFAPSAKRGQDLFNREWKVSEKMPNCTTCHGKNLKGDGKHVVTEKRIAPLSPAANPERFSSTAKVEKWFKRNCTEVIGRECTAAEKADFVQFVSKGG